MLRSAGARFGTPGVAVAGELALATHTGQDSGELVSLLGCWWLPATIGSSVKRASSSPPTRPTMRPHKRGIDLMATQCGRVSQTPVLCHRHNRSVATATVSYQDCMTG